MVAKAEIPFFYFQYFNLEVSFLTFNAISGVLQHVVVTRNTVLGVLRLKIDDQKSSAETKRY